MNLDKAKGGKHMVRTLYPADYPASLRNIYHPPQQLFVREQDTGAFDDIMARKRVAIVGTRKITSYGQSVTSRLAGELAAHDIVVISGLAIGTDAVAHQAALEAQGLTMAVLPSPVENVQPRTHIRLAQQILQQHGALVSEYPADSPIYKPNFVARNRIVSGLADALLITEAADNSGTMHTAKFALEQGATVMAVPGNILSPTSAGTNNLLKTGATPVTSIKDIFHVLGIKHGGGKLNGTFASKGANQHEQQILDLIVQGISSGGDLLRASGQNIEQFNSNLTMLEITAKIRALGNNYWALA
jgi:DNA processing protein